MKVLVLLLQHIGFAPKYEHKGTANVAHVQGFIVLIEHQYGVVHPAEPFGSGLPWLTLAPGTDATVATSLKGIVAPDCPGYQDSAD